MESVNWLEELQRKYPIKVEHNEVNLKRGRPVGSKNKKPKPELTKEQWKAAYWKLRRQYRKECLPK